MLRRVRAYDARSVFDTVRELVATASGILLGAAVAGGIARSRAAMARTRLLRAIATSITRLEGPGLETEVESLRRPEYALEQLDDALDALRRKAGEAEEESSLLRSALRASGAAVAVYDSTGELVISSNRFVRLADSIGRSDELSARCRELALRVIFEGVDEASAELCYELGLVRTRAIPLDAPKKRLGVICVVDVHPTEKASPTAPKADADNVGKPEGGPTHPEEVPIPVETDPPHLADQQWCDLPALVSRLVSEGSRWGAVKGIKVDAFRCPARLLPPPVEVSESAIELMLADLLSEVIELARPGSAIELGTARVAGEVLAWIAYEGDAPAPAFQAAISDTGWQRTHIAGSPPAQAGGASCDKPRSRQAFRAGVDAGVPRNALRLCELRRQVGLRTELTVVEGVGARITISFGSAVQRSSESLYNKNRADTVDVTTP